MCILHYGFSTAVGLGGMLAVDRRVSAFAARRQGDLLLPGRRQQNESTLAPLSAVVSAIFGLWVRHSRFDRPLAAVLALLSLVAVNSHLIFWPTLVQQDLVGRKKMARVSKGLVGLVWVGRFGVRRIVGLVIGAKRAVILSLVFRGMLVGLCSGRALWSNHNFVFTMFSGESALAGLLQVSMFALFMGICWPPVAATQFTALYGAC